MTNETDLIKAAEEALEIAKGNKPAARLHQSGHTYVPKAELEAAQARIAELEGQNQRLIEDRARFPDRPDWVGDVIGAHLKNMEHRIESAERYTRQYEARLRMEQRKTKELIEALKNIVTWGNSDHCTKLRSIARAALEGKG